MQTLPHPPESHPFLRNLGPGWPEALAPVAPDLQRLGEKLGPQGQADSYLPAQSDVMRAFTLPFEDVKVLILGQDPYPTPGHAMGLAFSVAPGEPLPRSLRNIYEELYLDTGHPPPTTGDLTPWSKQGVLLLNRVLTVQPGKAGSHRGIGWEKVTEQALVALAKREKPLVAILWGRDAQKAAQHLGDTPTVVSAHPSPLSAHRGFHGSKPFTRTNELLQEQGADPIDWRLH